MALAPYAPYHSTWMNNSMSYDIRSHIKLDNKVVPEHIKLHNNAVPEHFMATQVPKTYMPPTTSSTYMILHKLPEQCTCMPKASHIVSNTPSISTSLALVLVFLVMNQVILYRNLRRLEQKVENLDSRLDLMKWGLKHMFNSFYKDNKPKLESPLSVMHVNS
jgi:hypothetical protein